MDCWMSNLSSEKRQLPLHKLKIPGLIFLAKAFIRVAASGSHDSFTFALDTDMDIANDIPDMVRGMPQIPTIKQIICNWSRTQSLSTVAQLDAGVRYFDVRLSLPESFVAEANAVRAVHGLYAQPIGDIVDDVCQWLRAHPTEAILFDCNHFYNIDATLHMKLQEEIKRRFGELLQPRCVLSELTLENLAANKRQAVVFYQPRAEDNIEVDSSFFLSTHIKAPWAQTNLPYNMLQYQQDALMREKKRSHFHVSQCILTPNMADILRMASRCILHALLSLFLRLLKCKKSSNALLETKMAVPCTEMTLKWLHENENTLLPLLNIVIVDYVQTGDFCRKIVELNNH